MIQLVNCESQRRQRRSEDGHTKLVELASASRVHVAIGIHIRLLLINKTKTLRHVNCFVEVAIEKRIANVEVMKVPTHGG